MRACEDQRIEDGLQAIFASTNGTPSEAPTPSARRIHLPKNTATKMIAHSDKAVCRSTCSDNSGLNWA